ncbi:GNAT family N-acetyltransferase [Adhaeretor mobilis]|uniref:N-acetyltransferase domain-containing protein n=1 Tax=Adhaeretor mobilis TaxID=1930276 RepID=A0A517MZP8_9BACT|nr:hypothetical protein [Adhaeretor mobilis]QDT00345.1 hypothetical protein HG15A2_36810 [Adhaeretor mobilis]
MQSVAKPIRVLYKSLQKVLTLDVTWLMALDAEDVRERRTPGDVRLRQLTVQEVRSYSLLPDFELSPADAVRLEKTNHQCFAAFVDRQLAGYAWYAFEGIQAKYNRGRNEASGVAMTFPRHMAFMYKGYTHAKFRGRGLYGLLQQSALGQFSKEGVTTLLSTADWTNEAALAGCTRLGFKPVGRIWVAGVLGETLRKIPAAAKSIEVRGGASMSELRITSRNPRDGLGATPKPTRQLA